MMEAQWRWWHNGAGSHRHRPDNEMENKYDVATLGPTSVNSQELWVLPYTLTPTSHAPYLASLTNLK